MNKITGNMKMALLGITCAFLFLSQTLVYGQGSSVAVDESVVKSVTYTSENMRDPFEGYIVKQAAPLSASQLAKEENFTPPSLTITGITWGSNFPQAIINGKVVKAGDTVGEAQVVSISKDGLVFLYNNQKFSMPAPGAKSGLQSDKMTP